MFQWKDRFRIGIPEIDADHIRLFALAKDVHVALSQASPPQKVQDCLTALIDHTRAHFEREETIMVRTNYSDFPAHKQEHDRLTARALELQREFIANHRALSAEILRSMRDWLVHHIETSDRQLGEYAPCCPGRCASGKATAR